MKRNFHKTILISIGLVLCLAWTSYSGQYNYIPINGSVAHGLNNDNMVVGGKGSYQSGFLYDGINYFSINFPGASWSSPYDINNDGVIVGFAWSDVNHSFLYDGVEYTMLDVPGCAHGINDDGDIVGTFSTVSGSFLYDGVDYITIEVPGGVDTQAWGINNSSDIVGYYHDSNGYHGFVYDGVDYTTLDVPGASMTHAHGINDDGDIVGTYYDSNGYYGFVYDGNDYTTINVLDLNSTQAWGINNNGNIVGSYVPEGSAINHAFLLTPDPCADLGGDTDEDEVCDDFDNCPTTPNPDQEDSDSDGVGNACDCDDEGLCTANEWYEAQGTPDPDCILEPDIQITDAYTMNCCGDEFDVFGIWDPIEFYVECKVSGDPAKTYKVVIIVKARSLGEKIVQKYTNVKDGDTINLKSTTLVDFRLIDDGDALGSHTVKFIAKLKKGGLLDKDTHSYTITVQEERPDFTCY